MLSRITYMLLLGCLTLVLSNCASQPETTDAEPESTQGATSMPDPIRDTSWLAVKIFGQEASAAHSTLQFDNEGNASGSTGCNNFRGEVTLSDSSINFGVLAATRRMCEPAVSGQETVFLEALDTARYWARIGTTLQLLDDGNQTVIEFVDSDSEHQE